MSHVHHHPGWHHHPAVPSGDDLTLGQRAADRMRNGMGSWAFGFAAQRIEELHARLEVLSDDNHHLLEQNGLILEALAARIAQSE